MKERHRIQQLLSLGSDNRRTLKSRHGDTGYHPVQNCHCSWLLSGQTFLRSQVTGKIFYGNIFILILLFKHFSAVAKLPVYFNHKSPPRTRLSEKHLRTKVKRAKAYFSSKNVHRFHNLTFETELTPPPKLPFLDLAPIFSLDGQAICVFVSSMI